jgi:UDP-2-acetamido-3-amino-2,3-dideoxy-glucuronate N-acetyltransferase
VKQSTDLRVGVAGAGYWGRIGPAREAHPGVATMTDFGELTAAVDAVVIATPAQFHAPLALEAIRAGRHVFIEKPLALSVADALQIADAADRASVRAVVGHVLLYHPALRALLEAVERGAIGDVTHVRSRRLGLGRLRGHEDVWWSFAPHDVAICLTLMGADIVDAGAAFHCMRDTMIADFAYADLEFGDGRSAHIEVSWFDPNRSARLDVFGSRGLLTFEDSRGGATLTRRSYGATQRLETWSDEPEAIPFGNEEPLRLELEAFVRAVRTAAPTLSDARGAVDVVRTLEMVDAIARRSARVRGPA